ncbi:PPE family protein [Mycobacterium sp. 94-17]|uniref:PPE family protein n=1 Tax=Mycobacterium sp. 94-17 TaxID=2986147 RepID=UPI002D1F4CD5|nr:PPE family protein [Mycobacterium sp. 94-17]MEB4208702.1 PPE family protein [Mycobacterium sp. 94-17]
MDFATLPPEANSALMYSGPGAGSMMRAAAAWETLAARLATAAAEYRAVSPQLAACPKGRALVEAATRHVDWLDAVAARSGQAATQLAAAAGAHQSAFAATVPPQAIAGNRTRRLSLVSANCLGQHSAAIANADNEYEAMWAQNADAMHAYAQSAAAAVTLSVFPAPPGDPVVTTRNWALQSAPDVISAGGDVMSVIPDALRQLSSSPLTTFEAELGAVTPSLSKLNSVTAPRDFAIGHLNSMNKTAALRSLFPKPAAGGVRADLRCASPVGVLSAPRTWAAAARIMERSRADRFGEPIRLVAVSEPAASHPANKYGG